MGDENEEGLDLGNELPDENEENLEAVAGEEEEEEVGEEEDGDGDEDDASEPKSVPYSRFKEVIEERNALREIAKARQTVTVEREPESKAAAKAPFDFDAAEEALTNAVLEGDTKAVKKLRGDIRAAEIELMRGESAKAMAEELSKVEQRLAVKELQATAVELQTKYPFLDSTSKKANKDAIEDVVALRDSYMAKGDAPAEALRKAVKRVVPLYQKEEPIKKSAKDDGDENNGGKAVAAAAKVAAKQPPRGDGAGSRPGAVVVDPLKVKPQDWAKVPEKERNKLLV